MLIILNPSAGRGRRARRRLARVVAELQRRGCAAVVRRAGAEKGEVERLAREAEPDFDAIVAAGGDGTVNAVANGLAGIARPIAVLPLGTANVLAHEIGLPRRAEALAAVIAGGPAQPIWPGRVDARLFLTMASSGIDAETVAAVSPGLKRRAGRAAFVWAALRRLRHCRRYELVLRLDGIEHRAALIVAAKGRLYGGPFEIAPLADLGEPVLDFVLLRRAGRRAALRYAAALLLGRIPRLKDATTLRARSAEIISDATLPVQADGEIVGRLPISISIADSPLLLVRPCSPDRAARTGSVEFLPQGKALWGECSTLALWFRRCGL